MCVKRLWWDSDCAMGWTTGFRFDVGAGFFFFSPPLCPDRL